MERISELFAQNGALQLFAPMPKDDANAELLSTRRIMYLPAKYAVLFVDMQGYTTRETREHLIPLLLTQEGDLIWCQVLINWLRVMMMATPVSDKDGVEMLGRPCNTVEPLCAPATSERSHAASQSNFKKRSMRLKQSKSVWNGRHYHTIGSSYCCKYP